MARVGSVKISRKTRAASTESRIDLRKSLEDVDEVQEKRAQKNLFDYSSVESSTDEDALESVLSFFRMK